MNSNLFLQGGVIKYVKRHIYCESSISVSKTQPMKLRLTYLILSIFFVFSGLANDHEIKVHFIYGSKPKSDFKKEEKRWFGGIHGGHVGLEYDENRVLNFEYNPKKRFHVFSHNKKRHSHYFVCNRKKFWKTFESSSDSIKSMTITIPIDDSQKMKLDSLAENYIDETPYDYAFFGYRCASATYEMLSQIGVVEQKSHFKTKFKIFYPKKLRVFLHREAKKNGWKIEKRKGSRKRIWERD